MKEPLCMLCLNFDHDNFLMPFVPLGADICQTNRSRTGCAIFPYEYSKGYPYGRYGTPQIDSIPCIEFVPKFSAVVRELRLTMDKQKALVTMLGELAFRKEE